MKAGVFRSSRDLRKSVGFVVLRISALLHELAAERLVFPVKDGGGLLVVLALFPLANNALFLDHALETLDRLFEVFLLVYDDVCHV